MSIFLWRKIIVFINNRSICLYFFIAYAGQLSILQYPSSLSFKGSDVLNSESLGDALAATIGYSTVHPSEWSGLYINDPFNPAKGVVALLIDGIDKLNLDSVKPITYEVDGNDVDESLDSLLFRIQEHNSATVDLDLIQGLEMVCFFFFIIPSNNQ